MTNVVRFQLAILLLATVVAVGACSDPTPTPTAVPDDSDEKAMQPAMAATTAAPTVAVYPSVLRWPEGRTSGAGVWIMGSGLEPGQWFEVWAGVNGLVDDIALFGLEGASLRQANHEGAFALAFTISGQVGREDLETLLVESQFNGPVTVSVVDMDTGKTLATTPWLVCGRERAEPWCASAQDVLSFSE